jgi:hypothetical protein
MFPGLSVVSLVFRKKLQFFEIYSKLAEQMLRVWNAWSRVSPLWSLRFSRPWVWRFAMFWDATSCSLLDGVPPILRNCRIHLEVEICHWRWRQYVPLKRWMYLPNYTTSNPKRLEYYSSNLPLSVIVASLNYFRLKRSRFRNQGNVRHEH